MKHSFLVEYWLEIEAPSYEEAEVLFREKLKGVQWNILHYEVEDER